MELYLNIDKVPGEVTEAEHKKWIKLHSYNFGIHSENVEDPSARGKLVSATGRYTPLMISKDTDITSPLIQQLVSMGTFISKVKIHACLDNEQKTPSIEIELTDVVVCSYDVSGAEGVSPTEQVGFRYAEIQVTNRNFDSKGAKITEPSFMWSLVNKKTK